MRHLTDWSEAEFAALPATLPVRLIRLTVSASGFRTQNVVLATTLLDPVVHPTDTLRALYAERWRVEGHFFAIKELLALDVLRCKSPALIAREAAIHGIAYNLVRALMQRAAHGHGVPLGRLSFKGSVDALRHWSHVIAAAGGQPKKQQALIDALLAAIARSGTRAARVQRAAGQETQTQKLTSCSLGRTTKWATCRTANAPAKNIPKLPYLSAIRFSSLLSRWKLFSYWRAIPGIKLRSNWYVGVINRKQSPLSPPSSISCFEQAILPHLDAAYNLARWLTGNDQDAQDVVQEACLRAFRAFAGFHGENGRAWLLTIVRNTAYTALQTSQATRQMTPFDEELHGGIESRGDGEATPATVLRGVEDERRIDKAIAALPEEFREAIVLRHQDGLSYKEIAHIAGVPTGTVMSRLARARARLKGFLAADEQPEASS